MPKAIVYKSTGNFYQLKDENNKQWTGRLRGKLKIDEEIKSSNPIAVGDIVEFETENEEDSLVVIHEIKDRNNYIVRVSPQNRNQKHIVSANIDQAILVCTLSNPVTSFGFIDRFLVTAAAYHIPVVIIFNKSDLLSFTDQQHWMYIQNIYEKIGYEIHLISAASNDNFDIFTQITQEKTSLLAGHSGVGKSSILNKLIPERQQKVQEVSDWSGRGKHTTTFAEMMDLPFGGRLIDTPGVKEFGIVDMEPEELSHYFLEMNELLNDCKFNNCMHLDEPGCAVKDALMAGEVAIDRYESYMNILDSLPKDKY